MWMWLNVDFDVNGLNESSWWVYSNMMKREVNAVTDLCIMSHNERVKMEETNFRVCLEFWLFIFFWGKIELASNWRRLFQRLFLICNGVNWMLGIKEKRLIVEKGKENWIWRFWVELWYFAYFCVWKMNSIILHNRKGVETL